MGRTPVPEEILHDVGVPGVLTGTPKLTDYGSFVLRDVEVAPDASGDRTCNGGAYTFQIPGALAVAEDVVIPMRVQDAASIRCIYAYVQTPTTDGQSAYL